MHITVLIYKSVNFCSLYIRLPSRLSRIKNYVSAIFYDFLQSTSHSLSWVAGIMPFIELRSKEQIKLFGHVMWMGEVRIPKKMLHSKNEGK
jgi:hypothetical protein